MPGAGSNAARRGVLAGAMVVPGAPTISAATFLVGSPLTITPNANPGNPIGTFLLYRSGVLVGPVVSGYLLLDADMGPTITVRATNAAGTSVDSNSLVFVLPAADLAADWNADSNVNEGGGRVTSWISAAPASVVAAVGIVDNQPTYSAGGGPNGHSAVNFAINAGNATGLPTNPMGLGAPVSIYSVARRPAVGVKYLCDGASISDSRVIAQVAGDLLRMYAGTVGPESPLPAVGSWFASASRFGGATSKQAVNTGGTQAGDVGAGLNSGHTIGCGGTFVAATGWTELIARQIVYSVTHNDATAASILAYLRFWAGL